MAAVLAATSGGIAGIPGHAPNAGPHPEEALNLLRRASQRASLRLHVLAARVVAQVASPPADTGAQPTQPAASNHP